MPGPDRKRRLTAFVVAMAVLIVTPLAVVASDRFNDVPDSNIFHDDIAWLADNDVTRGCNPPDNDEFCPSDNVTRQQMAAFMRRLAENEVVNAATANEADHATTADSATTAGDADTLDGKAPSAYDTFVVGDTTQDVDTGAPANQASLLEVSFSSPVETTAVVTGTASVTLSDVALVDFDLWAQHNNTTCAFSARLPGSNAQATVAPAGTEPLNNSVAFTLAMPLSVGTHSLTLCGDGGVVVVTAGLTALVSPSDQSIALASTETAPAATDR